jgi:hypothetical protein
MRDATCIDCGRYWMEYTHDKCECGGELEMRCNFPGGKPYTVRKDPRPTDRDNLMMHLAIWCVAITGFGIGFIYGLTWR